MSRVFPSVILTRYYEVNKISSIKIKQNMLINGAYFRIRCVHPVKSSEMNRRTLFF